MALVQLYSKCYKKCYKNKPFSKATFFVLLCRIFCIVAPFLIAYYTKGFFIRINTLYEQPSAKFTGLYYLEAITDNSSRPILCTNFPLWIIFDEDLDVCSSFKVREIDDNEDGKNDLFNFSIHVLVENVKIKSAMLILNFRYHLQNNCEVNFNNIVKNEYLIREEVKEITVVGTLELLQSQPVSCLDNSGLNTIPDPTKIDFHNTAGIFDFYLQKNLATGFKTLYTTVNYGSDEYIIFNLQMRIPHHNVYYKLSLMETLKWALVQYLAFYAIIYLLIDKIKAYVFNNKILLFYEIKSIENCL